MASSPVLGSAAPVQTDSYTQETQDLIDYYARRGFYRHIQRVATEYMRKAGSNEKIAFWRAFALCMEGNYTDAIRELDPLQGKRDISLAVTAALVVCHSNSQRKDKEVVAKLKEQLKADSNTNNEAELVFGARYFIHCDKAKQARKIVEKVLKTNRKNTEALTLLAWLNLESGEERLEKKATLFEASMNLTQKRDVGAILGHAAFFERQKNFARVLEDLNYLIVTFPSFTPALIEKARVLMVMENWDESLECVGQLLKQDPFVIDALRILVVYLLARENKPQVAAAKLSELQQALDRNEPQNPHLLFQISSLVSRLASRRPAILQMTSRMIESACKLAPLNSVYRCELAFQQSLLQDLDKASTIYSQICEEAKMDDTATNVQAIAGRIKCRILQGQLVLADQELEFLTAMQEVTGLTPETMFLVALLAWHKDRNEAKAVAHLNKAIDAQFAVAASVNGGLDFYRVFDVDFVMEIIREYMIHIGTEPLSSSDPPNPVLAKVSSALEAVVHHFPGFVDAQYLLAKCRYVASDFVGAEEILHNCFQLEPQYSDPYLLLAQICMAKNNFKQCAQAIEQALALSFEVRNTPLYHVIKAKLLDNNNQTADALKLLEIAMNLPGVRKANAKAPFPLQDRLTVFLETANLHTKLGHVPEAAKIMQDARHEFERTSEFTRVVLADADLALRRKDIDAAIAMLQTVSAESVYYTRARIKMARIFLEQRRNRKAFAQCYEQLVQLNPTVHQYILLGEAYMEIQEPEKAIKAYETALKQKPDDPILASRIGRALIATHDFQRAVQFYEAAVKADPSSMPLYHDLADLYLQLQQYDQAVRVLNQALSSHPNSDVHDVRTLMGDIKSQLIMADVYSGSKNMTAMEQALKAALASQVALLNKLKGRDAEMHRQESVTAATICYRLADYCEQQTHDLKQAEQFYQEALKHNDVHEPSLLALAKLQLRNEDLEGCQRTCVTLLRLDPNNTDANMMLADLMFRKEEHEAATFHFQQLLEKNPTRYPALAKLIRLLNRSGRIQDAPKFLKLAERASPRAAFDAGFNFCSGLYHWLSNNPSEALKFLNLARKDGEWGSESLRTMIEVFITPDRSVYIHDSASADPASSPLASGTRITDAQALLSELFSRNESVQSITVLESYILMASGDKAKLDAAMQKLTALLMQDRDNVPAIVALATVFWLKKDEAKARTQLKRVVKMKPDSDCAHDFERAWIMMADLYIQGAKYDNAKELLKKALGANRSCAKAWELTGLIAEKQEMFKAAADSYELAWKLSNEQSPHIGFKLAYNYLKDKRLVEAIDVCNKILKANPKYPKIQKEILEKARAALRP